MSKLLTMQNRPVIKCLMEAQYKSFGRTGMASRNTYDAVVCGERRSATVFPSWPAYGKWSALKQGFLVRVFDTKQADRRCVDVIVVSVQEINLRNCSADTLEEWSRYEGWSAEFGRELGRAHGTRATWVKFTVRYDSALAVASQVKTDVSDAVLWARSQGEVVWL